jgi:hypothetical protein
VTLLNLVNDQQLFAAPRLIPAFPDQGMLCIEDGIKTQVDVGVLIFILQQIQDGCGFAHLTRPQDHLKKPSVRPKVFL